MSRCTPKRRSKAVLDYINAHFTVVEGTVTRRDGYKGCIVHRGYIRFHIPREIVGSRKGTAKYVYAHHISWFLHRGKWLRHELDHFDFNPSNNSIDNLREVKSLERKQQYDRVRSIVYWRPGKILLH